jgi:hypothetical protein
MKFQRSLEKKWSIDDLGTKNEQETKFILNLNKNNYKRNTTNHESLMTWKESTQINHNYSPFSWNISNQYNPPSLSMREWTSTN